MLPQVKLETVGDGIDASFARALPLVQTIDLGRPFAALVGLVRLGDTAHLVQIAETNPLAWQFPAEMGLDRAHGATSVGALGDVIDQSFVTSVLIPTYLEAIKADQPVVHRITAIANHVFLSYRRLAVPIGRSSRAGPASHLVLLTRIEFAIPQNVSSCRGKRLTCRERQCLSLAAAGWASKQIAATLNLSEKTVEFHLAGVRRKLCAHTTVQAVATALLTDLLND